MPWYDERMKIAILLAAGVMFAAGGCATPTPNTSFASYGVSSQQQAAALVSKWRADSRVYWQEADALDREAEIHTRDDAARNRDVIDRKRSLAKSLRAEADERDARATELQRLLPIKMIQ